MNSFWIFPESDSVARAKPAFFLSAFVGMLLCGAVAFFLAAYDPGPRTPCRDLTVRIKASSSPADISRAFMESGIVARPLVFRVLLSGAGLFSDFRPGAYRFGCTVSPAAALRAILNGPTTYVVTIPGNSSTIDVARVLSGLGVVGKAEFLSEATSEDAVARIGFPGATGEGFLAPGVYSLRRGMTAREVVAIMHGRFLSNLKAALRANRGGLKPMELVVMASIIEAETSNHKEKPLISGVFRKRLAIGMPLQADPTVEYGLGKRGGRLKKSDLQKDHPYNTYTRKGLPAAPISNPGPESLMAAAKPASTRYLYFLSTGGGEHRFSSTYEEHERKRRGADG